MIRPQRRDVKSQASDSGETMNESLTDISKKKEKKQIITRGRVYLKWSRTFLRFLHETHELKDLILIPNSYITFKNCI